MVGLTIVFWIAFLFSVVLFEIKTGKRLAVFKQMQNLIQKFGRKERELPSDMVHEIMKLLSNDDLLSFSQASKSCHSYAEKLWKQRLDGLLKQSQSYSDPMDGLSSKLHYFLILPRATEFSSKMTSSVDLLSPKTYGLPWFQLWKTQSLFQDPFLPIKLLHNALFTPAWFDRYFVSHRGPLFHTIDFKSVTHAKQAIVAALLILHLPLFQLLSNLITTFQGDSISFYSILSESWAPTRLWTYKEQFLICFMLFVYTFFEARLKIWQLMPIKACAAFIALVLSEGLEKLLAVSCTVGLAWLIVWFLNQCMFKSAGFKSDSKPFFWFFVLCAYYPVFSMFGALYFVVASAVSIIPPRHLLVAGMIAEAIVLLTVW
jgi:hypothetical protein